MSAQQCGSRCGAARRDSESLLSWQVITCGSLLDLTGGSLLDFTGGSLLDFTGGSLLAVIAFLAGPVAAGRVLPTLLYTGAESCAAVSEDGCDTYLHFESHSGRYYRFNRRAAAPPLTLGRGLPATYEMRAQGLWPWLRNNHLLYIGQVRGQTLRGYAETSTHTLTFTWTQTYPHSHPPHRDSLRPRPHPTTTPTPLRPAPTPPHLTPARLILP